MSTDKLPDGWMKKESSKRPGQFYFFNKTTGKSQWHSPTAISKVPTKTAPESQPVARSKDRLKGQSRSEFPSICDKSKQSFKRKSKTPAQDRLNTLQVKLKLSQLERGEKLQTFKSVPVGNNNEENASTTNDMVEDMEWESCDYSFEQIENMAVEILTESAYIVPDTNVFLDCLASIKGVIENDRKLCILIPFVVLQELDKLKGRRDKSSVSMSASRAIRYIYEELKSRNPRVQGQKATEDNDHLINVTSPDDKILNCCLQLASQSKEVILVTNDINLSNKCLLSGIEAITGNQCLQRF